MEHSEFLNAKQVAEYLDLNEKKVYALANDGQLPATKITGKWLFPKSLLDKWIIDSCHNGAFSDRLLIAGSDDPLLQMIVGKMGNQLGSNALVGYTSTGSRQGLSLLSKGHVDICAIHWGQASEAPLRHPALLQQYTGSRNWVLIHAYERVQGIIINPKLVGISDAITSSNSIELTSKQYKWGLRQQGAGSLRTLDEWLHAKKLSINDLNAEQTYFSERELGAAIACGEIDVGCGSQSTAGEYQLTFIPLYTEAFELVIPKNIFFKTLVQHMLNELKDTEVHRRGDRLGGYSFARSGLQIWSGS